MFPDPAAANSFLGFYAIYDFRLLWRANLFIDERVDGDDDWNDLHPISFDEWRDDEIGGGQIQIKSFTNFWDNRDVYGKVAYSHGCFDSPINFNIDMECQKETLNFFRTNGWFDTLAPEAGARDWANYATGTETSANIFQHPAPTIAPSTATIGPETGYLSENNQIETYTIEVDDYASEMQLALLCYTPSPPPILEYEDFESGSINYEWTTGGNANWTVNSSSAYEGSYAAQTGDISDGQFTYLEFFCDIPAEGSISFYYRISSEAGYDILIFYIDGVYQNSWSGTIGWTQASFSVSGGSHSFKWEYLKDGSVSSGSDCAWIDFIALNIPYHDSDLEIMAPDGFLYSFDDIGDENDSIPSPIPGIWEISVVWWYGEGPYELTGTINYGGQIDFYPFRPGFSSERQSGTNDPANNGGNYTTSTVAYSAGADCSGFVQQAAGYGGNRYHEDITYAYISGVKTNIVNTRQEWTDNGSIVPGKQHPRFGTDFSTEIDRNALVPGDILWSGGHIVIVQDVVFTGDTRDVDPGSQYIWTIQSTSWLTSNPDLKDWWVRKDKTWRNLDNPDNPNFPIYTPRRLTLY